MIHRRLAAVSSLACLLSVESELSFHFTTTTNFDRQLLLPFDSFLLSQHTFNKPSGLTEYPLDSVSPATIVIMSAPAMTGLTGPDTWVTMKVFHEGQTRRFKLRLRDLGANSLESKVCLLGFVSFKPNHFPI